MNKFEFPWRKSARLKSEKKALENQQLTIIRQKALGEKLTTILRTAALSNSISNILPNGKLSQMGPIRIVTQPSNADSFSIFAIMDCDPSMGNIPEGGGYQNIYQIDINLSKTSQELNLFFSYHSEQELSWDISRLDEFKDYIVAKVETFTMFPWI